MLGSPINLVAIVESYPPMLRAGSEIALHQTLRELVKRGFTATVAVTQNGPFQQKPFSPFVLEGVCVVPYDELRCTDPPDIVFTHLYAAVHFARAWAERHNAPLVYWSHTQGAVPGRFALVVFNAAYLADDRYPHIVFHPPVFPAEYRVARKGADKITRIGLSPQKGGYVFWQLVRHFPDKEFLGVIGGWGPQITKAPDGRIYPNVTIIENTEDIRSVYAQTRILIVPSDLHETWCRIAVEAMASGIPVIGSGIPALRESLGEAGIFCSLELEDWVSVINCLDNPKHYACHSRLAKKRSRELDPSKMFPRLTTALEGLLTS